MEFEILAEKKICTDKSLFISTLSRRAFEESGCEAFNCSNGYFLYERHFNPDRRGIEILAKLPDFESAVKMVELWEFEDVT